MSEGAFSRLSPLLLVGKDPSLKNTARSDKGRAVFCLARARRFCERGCVFAHGVSGEGGGVHAEG